MGWWTSATHAVFSCILLASVIKAFFSTDKNTCVIIYIHTSDKWGFSISTDVFLTVCISGLGPGRPGWWRSEEYPYVTMRVGSINKNYISIHLYSYILLHHPYNSNRLLLYNYIYTYIIIYMIIDMIICNYICKVIWCYTIIMYIYVISP